MLLAPWRALLGVTQTLTNRALFSWFAAWTLTYGHHSAMFSLPCLPRNPCRSKHAVINFRTTADLLVLFAVQKAWNLSPISAVIAVVRIFSLFIVPIDRFISSLSAS